MRARLAPILGVWGLSWQQRGDALLVMSELVTNAVEHARTPLVLGVSFTGSMVLIDVNDGSLVELCNRWIPQPSAVEGCSSWTAGPQLELAGGRGRWAEMAAVDQHEQPSSDLAGHGQLLTDTDQVEQAKQPRRAPRDPEVDGPHPSGLRGDEQRGDPAGTEERGVRQRDLNAGRPRGGSQLLVEARLECRRRETVDIAMHTDDHAPARDLHDVAVVGSWVQVRVFHFSE
jgi:hypothetical protein